MVINTVFSLILCEEQFCSRKCGYDSYLGYNHYNGPRGLETVWLMAAPSTIHGPHHHWLWCTWLWYVEGNPIMYDSSAWLSSASSYRWWLYLCMDCLTIYVAPWSLAGIAVPVTFISVAVECSTAIWGIMWWYGRKSMPISEWIINVLGIDLKLKSLSK